MSALWGAIVGPHVTISLNNFVVWKLASAAFAILAVIFQLLKSQNIFKTIVTSCCFLLSGFIWGAIHSPREFEIQNAKAKVIWSSGCRATESDLLLNYGETLFVSKGFAVQGDLVELNRAKRFKFSKQVQASAFALQESWICNLGRDFRTLFNEKIARFPLGTAQWLRGFVLGEKSAMDVTTIQLFRELGLLHILVLSGGHLAIVSSFLSLLLRVPLTPLYVARFISINSWAVFWSFLQCLLILFLGIFCLVVGFSQSVQRAFIVVVVMNLAGIIGYNLPPRRKVLSVLVLQILCFPVHLLSMSMLLSWSGSLILIAFSESNYLMNFWQRIKLLICIQFVFFVSSLMFFGSAGVLSPVANLLGQLIFGVLLPIDVFAIFVNFNWLDHWVVSLNRAVLQCAEHIASLQQLLPVSMILVPKNFTINTLLGRALMVSLFVLLFWLTHLKRNSHRDVKLNSHNS